MSLFITIYVVWGFLKMVTGTDIDIEEHCGLENTDQWGQRKKKRPNTMSEKFLPPLLQQVTHEVQLSFQVFLFQGSLGGT